MRLFCFFLPLSMALLIGCSSKQYEDCAPGMIVDDWGVSNDTYTFGEYDSLYYVFNPVANVADSIYYNGNYTDSYYHADSTRVMLRYTTQDSIIFHIDRLYAVETNPVNMVMIIEAEDDSLNRECVLHLKKDTGSDRLYRCGPDSLFKKMLLSGSKLKVSATNGASTSEPQGSQNYEFVLYAKGFDKALAMADSLNKPVPKKKVRQDSVKSDKKFKLF